MGIQVLTMAYFAMLCLICQKHAKIKVKDIDEAKSAFQNMIVCPASVHPSFPSVFAHAIFLEEIDEFRFRHSSY